jgi:hypothetical protein
VARYARRYEVRRWWGLTAKGRAKREAVRLTAAELFAQGMKQNAVVKRLRICEMVTCQIRARQIAASWCPGLGVCSLMEI